MSDINRLEALLDDANNKLAAAQAVLSSIAGSVTYPIGYERYAEFSAQQLRDMAQAAIDVAKEGV